MASEAVGGRAACSVDNDGGSASSRSEAGPNGNGPCRIRSNPPLMHASLEHGLSAQRCGGARPFGRDLA